MHAMAAFRSLFNARVGVQRMCMSTSVKPARTAIVTGAGQGIGRAIALRLAQDGFDVCVNDLQSNAKHVEGVIQEIQSVGRQSVAAYADVSQLSQVEDMVATSVNSLGPLTVMVANAGIANAKPILEITEHELKRILDINIGGVFHCNSTAGKQFIKQGTGGKILNAASGTSFRTDPALAHYSATKAAVRSITQSFAIILGPHGITVNGYAPGIVDTGMWEEIDRGMGAMNGMKKGENFKRHELEIPLRRTSIPEDPAKLVSWLASPEADYVTGQTIVIDGGLVFS
ncbi:NAD(P)-binding protein [Hymenopellis radicata]|nr:NAD(P)-binding protein [Hymenopellis radicata]